MCFCGEAPGSLSKTEKRRTFRRPTDVSDRGQNELPSAAARPTDIHATKRESDTWPVAVAAIDCDRLGKINKMSKETAGTNHIVTMRR
jgi:hypothetical protein